MFKDLPNSQSKLRSKKKRKSGVDKTSPNFPRLLQSFLQNKPSKELEILCCRVDISFNFSVPFTLHRYIRSFHKGKTKHKYKFLTTLYADVTYNIQKTMAATSQKNAGKFSIQVKLRTNQPWPFLL